MTYGETLKRAHDLLTGDRDAVRGDPKLVYHRASQIATALLGRSITPADIAAIMVATKFAREAVGVHDEDNYVDAAAWVDILAYLSKPGPGAEIKCGDSNS